MCASTNSAESVCASSKVSDGLALRALHAHCVFVTAASAQMLEPVIAPATALRRLIMTRFSPSPPPLSRVVGKRSSPSQELFSLGWLQGASPVGLNPRLGRSRLPDPPARPGTPTATRDAAGGIYSDGSAYMVLCFRLGIRKVLGICVLKT